MSATLETPKTSFEVPAAEDSAYAALSYADKVLVSKGVDSYLKKQTVKPEEYANRVASLRAQYSVDSFLDGLAKSPIDTGRSQYGGR